MAAAYSTVRGETRPLVAKQAHKLKQYSSSVFSVFHVKSIIYVQQNIPLD